MPGRTPDSPDDRGTPNGPAPTDSGVCAISPSDLVGYTGNLINRVNQLEQRIAELEAANIEVNQLSDLSQQIGWVDGITYMGVEGWTQTSYGTLIPPAGFTLLGSGLTMSDGNSYQAVVYDEDGVLQYGFGQVTPTGTFTAVTGAQASGSNFAVIYTNNPIRASTTSTGSDFATLTIGYDPQALVSLTSSTIFAVATSGWYYITAKCTPQAYNDASGDGLASMLWSITGNTASSDIHSNTGVQLYTMANGEASNPQSQSGTRLMFLASGSTHTISGNTLNGGGTPTMIVSGATITLQLVRAASAP